MVPQVHGDDGRGAVFGEHDPEPVGERVRLDGDAHGANLAGCGGFGYGACGSRADGSDSEETGITRTGRAVAAGPLKDPAAGTRAEQLVR
ncbi:hypothetical protein rosag_23600 [Roseisolibacter agri]|uniref:Uncharacterized protein n=1 Tax=Roseisolibacter agri TaxID=2014610 RepID=A0AA37Q8U7_9BACT|nr:hypothetical protein rosag_23600 [Roseisolibacter agri]